MTWDELIAYCLTFPAAYVDYPFGDGAVAVRHRGNSKVFALFTSHAGQALLNLKCEPLMADFLRQQYRGVIPGYHMNKTHWNSVVIASDVPAAEVRWQIEQSYALVRPKPKMRKSTAGH